MKLNSLVSLNNVLMQDFPFRSELVMQAYLHENNKVLMLDGHDEIDIRGTEVKWKSGQAGGRIDILAVYDQEKIAIIELKLGDLTEDHLSQLKGYFENKKHLEAVSKGLSIEGSGKYTWLGLLVGTGVTESLLDRLKKDNFMLFPDIPVVVVTLKRYKSVDDQVFVFSDVMAPVKAKKDRTKYLFNNKEYGKGRLVLALVKQCVLDGEDYMKIGGAFTYPKGRPFVLPLEEAKRANTTPTSKGTLYYHYYVDGDDPVSVEDGKIAVTYWWTINEMPRVIEEACKLGYKIKEIKK